MSNVPGATPIRPELEEVADAADDKEPTGAPEQIDDGGDADQGDAPTTRERDTGKGPLTP